jgi:hypothetical protein
MDGSRAGNKIADTGSLPDSLEVAGLESGLSRRIKNAAGSALKDITQSPMLTAEMAIAVVAKASLGIRTIVCTRAIKATISDGLTCNFSFKGHVSDAFIACAISLVLIFLVRLINHFLASKTEIKASGSIASHEQLAVTTNQSSTAQKATEVANQILEDLKRQLAAAQNANQNLRSDLTAAHVQFSTAQSTNTDLTKQLSTAKSECQSLKRDF